MTSAARRALGSILVLVLLDSGPPARAEEPPTEQSKREAKLHFDLGTAYFNAGKFDLAIVEYEKAHQLHHAPLLLFNLGQTSRKKGDRVAALKYYKEFLKADPTGSRSAEAQKYIEALEQEQAQAVRDEAKAHLDKATDLYNTGRYDDAIAEYEAANRILPLPALDFYVAQALRKKGARQRAIQRYRKYLAAAPVDAAKSAEAKRYVDEFEAEERAEREAAAKAQAAARRPPSTAADRTSRPAPAPPSTVNSLAFRPPTDDAPPYPARRSRWRLWVGIAGGAAAIGVGAALLSVYAGPSEYGQVVDWRQP